MAGSFNHVTTKKGKLISPEKFPSMIENLGDAYEVIEEMYGMIWVLAENIANDSFGAGAGPKIYVEGAEDAYKRGLEVAKVALGGHESKRFKEKLIFKLVFDTDEPNHDAAVLLELIKASIPEALQEHFTIRHSTV